MPSPEMSEKISIRVSEDIFFDKNLLVLLYSLSIEEYIMSRVANQVTAFIVVY
jgi:hypothetical protein